MQLQSEVAGRCSQALQCGLDIGIGRVDENGNDVRGGDQLVQQLQSLRSELHIRSNHAREITSRSAEGGDETKLDRVAAGIEHDWNRSGCCPCREHRSSVRRDNDGHPTTNQFGRHPWQPIISAIRPAVFDRHVSALDIARLLQALTECIQHGPVSVERCPVQKPYHRHRRLLRACRERPRCCRAAEQRDELAPLHSITSSAMASSPGGKLRPNALAVLRLITKSNLIDCMTGKSTGFSPLRTRPVYTPAWRYASLRLVP